MKNLNVLKYCGIASLIIGLSSCFMMDRPQNSQPMGDYPAHHKMHHDKNMPHDMNKVDKAMQQKDHAKHTKHYASKDVTQKATPGPKRKAAPQLPVIQ